MRFVHSLWLASKRFWVRLTVKGSTLGRATVVVQCNRNLSGHDICHIVYDKLSHTLASSFETYHFPFWIRTWNIQMHLPTSSESFCVIFIMNVERWALNFDRISVYTINFENTKLSIHISPPFFEILDFPKFSYNGPTYVQNLVAVGNVNLVTKILHCLPVNNAWRPILRVEFPCTIHT